MISDNYLDGMHAWARSYHGVTQSSTCLYPPAELNLTRRGIDLLAEPLFLSSGVIWTALNLDYPGHSFSHLGFFRGTIYLKLQCVFGINIPIEGVNGRLPNQDLINSFNLISQYTAGVPVVMYDHREPNEFPGRQQTVEWIPSWVPRSFAEQQDVLEYTYRVRNILKHVGYQARGTASGVHGLLHQ